ncbi:MAG: hypothetical protein GY699_16550 [Desulfobacteraceae bacterium]|nr:hypothetical protein [Desulfobacteraceae bacterium]
MIREETDLGCGNNKAKYAGKMKYCIENGLDFNLYRLGPRGIKRRIRRCYGVELDIKDKSLTTITMEAQEIEYQ